MSPVPTGTYYIPVYIHEASQCTCAVPGTFEGSTFDMGPTFMYCSTCTGAVPEVPGFLPVRPAAILRLKLKVQIAQSIKDECTHRPKAL